MELTGVRRVPAAFSVEVENRIGSGNGGQHTKNFETYHGDRLIAELLIKAGYTTGTWRFRLTEPMRASGHTPVLQVRRPDPVNHGVIIHVKPGDNGSAIKGTLIVERDKGVTPDEVFQKLSAIVDADDQAREEILNKHTMATYKIDNLAQSIGQSIHAASMPSAVAESKPLLNSEAVVLNKEKLQKLATLPDRLAKVRAEIKNAYDRKEKIELTIMELEDQEKKLMSIDIGALAALLDSVE